MITKKFQFWKNVNFNSNVIKVNKTLFLVNILDNRQYSLIKNSIYDLNTVITLPIVDNDYFKVNLNETVHLRETNNYSIQRRKCFLKKKVQWSFIKFKYHGKGYKIKKYNTLEKLTFRFGKSHWTKVLYKSDNFTIKRTKKNVYCMVSTGDKYIKNWGKLILKIKGVNKYTKRGVRLARTKLFKRFGKISQASSVYK